MTPVDLIAFEREIATAFESGKIRGPVHLSGGNEEQLTEIFKGISPQDYVFSTWRSHYHALLHGIPIDLVREEIMAGRSMNLIFPAYHFYTSAIVGGILPMAVGVAAALQRAGSEKKVWAFVGDMAASTGIFHETVQYASLNALPIKFVVEDNGCSTDSPTAACWGGTPIHSPSCKVVRYKYERAWGHVNTGKWVNF